MPRTKKNRRQAIAQALTLTTASSVAAQQVAQSQQRQNQSQDRATTTAKGFSSQWDRSLDRIWPGPGFWSNPMENWEVRDGRLHCLSAAANHNVHCLLRQLGPSDGEFTLSARLGILAGTRGAAGFEIAIHDQITEYRSNCFWGSGIKAIVSTDGKLTLGKDEESLDASTDLSSVILTLTGNKDSEGYGLTLALKSESGHMISRVEGRYQADQLFGNIALTHNPGPTNQRRRGNRQNSAPRSNARFWFADWRGEGAKLVGSDDQTFGPILWSMHTINDTRTDEGRVMKMTALVPPMGPDDSKVVRLELDRDNQWDSALSAPLDPDARTATFRLPHWNTDRDVPYRLVYDLKNNDGTSTEHYWTGTLRKEPLDRPLKFAGLTCQVYQGFPYEPLVDQLNEQNPDMMFFSGDQIYESTGGFGVIRDRFDRATLNYLRKFYLFGWAFGDLMRDRPTVCIPDDHDVFQGNIWGAGGKAMGKDGNTSTDGGYIQPIRMVQAVHRTCTSHHPEPFDPTPILQNMSVYYTDIVFGRVSFAVLGDRQFKSAPRNVDTGGGRADHLSDPSIDVSQLDKPGLDLLGSRQEAFLEHWVADWRGADMKMLLSETVFANAATHHGSKGNYLIADLDSGGWPQTARNRAVRIIRKGFPLHVNGDQHLGSFLQYGADEQRDGCWAFCTPAISAGYPRWWRPEEMGRKPSARPDHGLENTGDFIDGFGNFCYFHAVGNPEGSRDPNRYVQCHIKGSGFGLIEVDREKRTYTCHCFRFIKEPGKEQHPGWPVTIHQNDNYGRTPTHWLPTIKMSGRENAVIQVIDTSDDSLVYARRIVGSSIQPHVFGSGTYKVLIGEGRESAKTIDNLVAKPGKTGRVINV